MQDPDWASLSQLDEGELQTRLLNRLDRQMQGLSYDEEDAVLAGLPAPLRVSWLLSWLDFEVTQGSLLAYFFNSHGRHARLAADALREIGKPNMASVLERGVRTVELHGDAWAANAARLADAKEFEVVTPYKELPNADELSGLTDEYWEEAERAPWWGAMLSAYLAWSVKELAAGGGETGEA